MFDFYEFTVSFTEIVTCQLKLIVREHGAMLNQNVMIHVKFTSLPCLYQQTTWDTHVIYNLR